MNERGHRVRELSDTLCRGKRHEAADHHVESFRTFPLPRKKVPILDFVRTHFLDGWDAAMEVRSDELAEENRTLHGMVIDLCQRLAIRRCEKCRGLGVNEDFSECGCDGGWIDAPQGEPERIVKEVKDSQ